MSHEKIVITSEELKSDSPIVPASKHEVDTAKLPTHPIDFIHDQRTYDLFRLGAGFRSAIEMAMQSGRERPNEVEMVTAFEDAKSFRPNGSNDELFNQNAFDERTNELIKTYEDFDPNAPLPTTLEINTHQDLQAVLAGLYAKGDLPTASQRRTLLEGKSIHPDQIIRLDDILEVISQSSESKDELESRIKLLPTIGGIQQAALKALEKDDWQIVYYNLGETVSDDYFERARKFADEQREFLARQKAEAAFAETPSEPPNPLVGRAAVIARQTLDLKEGSTEVRPVIVKLVAQPREPEATLSLAEKSAEETEAEVLRRRFKDALSSPEALLEALESTETSLDKEVRSKLKTAVELIREYDVAVASKEAWETIMAPKARELLLHVEAELRQNQELMDTVGDFPTIFRNFAHAIETDINEAADISRRYRVWDTANSVAQGMRVIGEQEMHRVYMETDDTATVGDELISRVRRNKYSGMDEQSAREVIAVVSEIGTDYDTLTIEIQNRMRSLPHWRVMRDTVLETAELMTKGTIVREGLNIDLLRASNELTEYMQWKNQGGMIRHDVKKMDYIANLIEQTVEGFRWAENYTKNAKKLLELTK